MATTETTLRIPALHCESCAETVARILRPLPSVEVTQTDLETKQVHIKFDEATVSLEQVRAALEDVGFFPED